MMRRTVNPLPKRIRERQVEQGTNPSYNLSDTLTGNGLWSSKLDLIFSNTHEGWAVGRTIQRADGVETERVLVLRTVDQGRHWQDLSHSLGQESLTGSAEDIVSDGPSEAVILTSQHSRSFARNHRRSAKSEFIHVHGKRPDQFR